MHQLSRSVFNLNSKSIIDILVLLSLEQHRYINSLYTNTATTSLVHRVIQADDLTIHQRRRETHGSLIGTFPIRIGVFEKKRDCEGLFVYVPRASVHENIVITVQF